MTIRIRLTFMQFHRLLFTIAKFCDSDTIENTILPACFKDKLIALLSIRCFFQQKHRFCSDDYTYTKYPLTLLNTRFRPSKQKTGNLPLLYCVIVTVLSKIIIIHRLIRLNHRKNHRVPLYYSFTSFLPQILYSTVTADKSLNHYYVLSVVGNFHDFCLDLVQITGWRFPNINMNKYQKFFPFPLTTTGTIKKRKFAIMRSNQVCSTNDSEIDR